MEVLFFHGFQLGDGYEEAYLTAWKCGDGSVWPQTWLVKEFPDARILSVSYNAGVLKGREKSTFDMYNMGENLTTDLLDAKVGQEPCRPVVLVGHSFGGIVIKQLCAYAAGEAGTSKQNCEKNVELTHFLENIKGIFFYSTPHHGIAEKIVKRFVAEGPLQEFVKILSTGTARLNSQFEKLSGQTGRYQKWRIAALGESLPTNLVRE
jgi:triacylglycerol esterase/lipase EstA (alpha/beta hydrolase family)